MVAPGLLCAVAERRQDAAWLAAFLRATAAVQQTTSKLRGVTASASQDERLTRLVVGLVADMAAGRASCSTALVEAAGSFLTAMAPTVMASASWRETVAALVALLLVVLRQEQAAAAAGTENSRTAGIARTTARLAAAGALEQTRYALQFVGSLLATATVAAPETSSHLSAALMLWTALNGSSMSAAQSSAVRQASVSLLQQLLLLPLDGVEASVLETLTSVLNLGLGSMPATVASLVLQLLLSVPLSPRARLERRLAVHAHAHHAICALLTRQQLAVLPQPGAVLQLLTCQLTRWDARP
jgi:hypothetical protein